MNMCLLWSRRHGQADAAAAANVASAVAIAVAAMPRHEAVVLASPGEDDGRPGTPAWPHVST